MQDLLGRIAGLNRPRLLVNAARFGVDDYNRNVHLPRLLRSVTMPRPGPAILQLLDLEAAAEARRVDTQSDYSVARHIELLIALLGEARFLRSQTRPDPALPQMAAAATPLPRPQEVLVDAVR